MFNLLNQVGLLFLQELYIRCFSDKSKVSYVFYLLLGHILKTRWSCFGLCCSSSQRPPPLYSLTKRSVTALCRLTHGLLAREVTCVGIRVENAWSAVHAQPLLLTHIHDTNIFTDEIIFISFRGINHFNVFISLDSSECIYNATNNCNTSYIYVVQPIIPTKYQLLTLKG